MKNSLAKSLIRLLDNYTALMINIATHMAFQSRDGISSAQHINQYQPWQFY